MRSVNVCSLKRLTPARRSYSSIQYKYLLVFVIILLQNLPTTTECFQSSPQYGYPQKYLSVRPYTATHVPSAHQQSNLSASHATNGRRMLLSMVTGKKDYNDDAFGFVFLGSLALTQDPVFAGSFFILSAAAAIATRSGKLPATKAVPASVAGCSLILATAVRHVLNGQDGFLGTNFTSTLPENAAWIQVGLCIVSMVYGFVMVTRDEGIS